VSAKASKWSPDDRVSKSRRLPEAEHVLTLAEEAGTFDCLHADYTGIRLEIARDQVAASFLGDAYGDVWVYRHTVKDTLGDLWIVWRR
jgi:hypothetical protein